MSDPRYIIYGAGGIGGTIGARLHLSDRRVVLIARGEHGRVLQSKGMHFCSPKIDRTLRIESVLHPREISFTDQDVVILCMKSQHTESALRDLQAVAPDTLPVVCCQNGVSNERAALRRFANVYGMVVWLPAEHLKPGVVVNFAENKAGGLDAGCYPYGIDSLITQVTADLSQAGFASKPQEKIMRYKYSKLFANLDNATGTVAGETDRDLSRKLREEALACYEAAGIEVATRAEQATGREGINGGSVPGHERHGSSSLQSVLRATGDIEADYLNGEIVQLGRLHGIPTPANVVVQRLANELIQKGKEVGFFPITEIKAKIASEERG